MSLTESAHQTNLADSRYMQMAIELAAKASQNGEVPIGAVVVCGHKVIGRGHNCPISSSDPTAHAEIQAVREACQNQSNYRLGQEATLYVTLMPCLMCMGAILHARIGRVVVGTRQSRYSLNVQQLAQLLQDNQTATTRCTIELGCESQTCDRLLKQFFSEKRQSREESLSKIRVLDDLPNINSEALAWLKVKGYDKPSDLLTPNLEQNVQAIEAAINTDVQVSPQLTAVIRALCHYLKGNPAISWRDFLS